MNGNQPRYPYPSWFAAAAMVTNVEVEELRKNYRRIPFRKNEIVSYQAYSISNRKINVSGSNQWRDFVFLTETESTMTLRACVVDGVM